MQHMRTDFSGNNRLRFVFDEAVVSLDLAANSTFEDVARTLGELEPRHYGKPIAIDVVLAAPSGSLGALHQIS